MEQLFKIINVLRSRAILRLQELKYLRMLIFIYYLLRHKVSIITKIKIRDSKQYTVVGRVRRRDSNRVETGRRSDTLEAILDTWYGELTVAAYLIIIVTLTIPSYCHEGIRNRDSVGTDELVTFKEVHHGQMTEDNRVL